MFWTFILKIVGIIGGVFGVLKTAGVAPTLSQLVVNDVTSIAAYEADFNSGQAVVIATTSILNEAAVIVVMRSGDYPAYGLLFGTEAPAVGDAGPPIPAPTTPAAPAQPAAAVSALNRDFPPARRVSALPTGGTAARASFSVEPPPVRPD